jgi:hypothetical protein
MLAKARQTIVGVFQNIKDITKPTAKPKQTNVTPLRAADLPQTQFGQHLDDAGRRLGRQDPRMMAEETYQRQVLETDQLAKNKDEKKAVLNTDTTMYRLEASLQRMAKEGLPPSVVPPEGKKPEHAVEILYQHFRQMKLRKGGPVVKTKKGRANAGLDSEEWVTMLDNAIAENENVQSGAGALEEPPRDIYTVPSQSLAVPQIMKVFDDEIRDDELEWVDPYLYQITFGMEATHPLGLELDWSTFPPVVKLLLPHTPAKSRGRIEIGDRLLVINGVPIASIPLALTAAAMRERPLTLVLRAQKPQAGAAPGSKPTPPAWTYEGELDRIDYLRTQTDRLIETEEIVRDPMLPYQLTNDLSQISRLIPADHPVQKLLAARIAQARVEVTEHDGVIGVPTTG